MTRHAQKHISSCVDRWWRDRWGNVCWRDAGVGWVYSQFRIENVQVAQIVCVVGWAEPGQHQQQQSLHGQCLVLLFFPAFFSSLYTEALSSFVHPISPSAFSTSNSPNPSVLTPPLLPSLALLVQRCWSELLLHFLPSQPVFIPSRSTCVSLWAWQSVAWSSQLQRQAGQLPEVEDGVEEVEEETGAGAEKNSRYNRGRGGESVRRRGRWHIWNTISDVLPLNLLRALVSRKRIYACVCGCLPLSVNVCARVCVRAMCSLWLILQ